jgi:hypothetical protein
LSAHVVENLAAMLCHAINHRILMIDDNPAIYAVSNACG